MDMAGLREAITQEPFEPFVIRVVDGRSVSIRHPEVVAVDKRRVVVIQVDDFCLWLEPLLIASIDWDSGATKKTRGNGHSWSKRPPGNN